MLNQVKVEVNQTLPDLAIQECGSVEALFDLAILNGMSVSDFLISGALLPYPPVAYDPATRKVFKDKGYKPASATTLPGQASVLDGIDYWIIERSFIVS